MTGILAAKLPALGHQTFQHVAIAHSGAFQRDGADEGLLEAEIAHQGADHTTLQCATPLVVQRNHIEQLVAIVEAAIAVDHDETIAIAVERYPQIGAMLDDWPVATHPDTSRRIRH